MEGRAELPLMRVYFWHLYRGSRECFVVQSLRPGTRSSYAKLFRLPMHNNYRNNVLELHLYKRHPNGAQKGIKTKNTKGAEHENEAQMNETLS